MCHSLCSYRGVRGPGVGAQSVSTLGTGPGIGTETQLGPRAPPSPGWASPGSSVTPIPPTVFTPRVIGTAVARYNFAARDMRELSLREGDVVKIYSRVGGDQGWWRGETNGRIGWFPSTYVEEEGVQ